MKIVKQAIFDKFLCLADKCPDTCCKGWQVVLDDGSVMPFVDNVCPYLNEKGLCKKVLKDGEDSLDYVCHMYPRHVEEYEDLREWSVSLSCPEAVNMTLQDQKHMEYSVTEDDTEDPLIDDFDDFDLLLFTKLSDARDVMFKKLREEGADVYKKMGFVLSMAKRLQECLDENRFFDMDDVTADFERDGFINIEPIDPYGMFKEYSGELNKLETLQSDWKDILDRIPNIIANPVKSPASDIDLINIFEALLFTYFLGAVYDDYIFAKALLCVFMTVAMDRLAQNSESMEEYKKTVYKFCKEVEHSDENINELLVFLDSKADEF